MAQTQLGFLHSVKEKLGEENIKIIRGDVFKFITGCYRSFDIVFADPPYDHKRFAEIPELILNSKMVSEGSLVIVEHSKNHDFSMLPEFVEQRVYGSVNFSIFRK